MALEQYEITNETILSALSGAAAELQEANDEERTEVLVTKAVCVYQYLDADGEVAWAYRRVKADWFDLGGAGQFLIAAQIEAWREENDGD